MMGNKSDEINLSKYHDVYSYEEYSGGIEVIGNWLEVPGIEVRAEDAEHARYKLLDELRWYFHELEGEGEEIPKPVTEYRYFNSELNFNYKNLSRTRNDIRILKAKLDHIISELRKVEDSAESRIRYRTKAYDFIIELRVALGI
jgi:hypothetical protein